MRNSTNVLRTALLCVCAPLAASAADQESSSHSTVFSGVEVDSQDSHRVDMGFALESGLGTRFDLFGSRSDASAEALDLTSTHAFGQLTHDFGRFGLGAGVRHMRDENLSRTLGYLGSAFVDFADVRLTATLEARGTDFDDTPFTVEGSEVGLTDVTSASGIATCSVDSLGYGLGLNVVRPAFSFYASATAFDYSSYECGVTVMSTTAGPTTSPVGPSERAPVRVTVPAAVTQLASNTTASFGGYSSTRVPREGALLESSLMLGASFALGERSTIGIELYRDSEEFAPSDTTTALAYLAFPITRSVSMDVTVGASDGDLLENTAFAGVRLTARFGR